MPRITFIEADGRAAQVDATVGKSLMRAAVDASVEGIAADCGGCLNCATCHVYVEAPWAARLPEPSNEEATMLDMTAAERRPSSRLSCQIVVTEQMDGMQVHLPDQQY